MIYLDYNATAPLLDEAREAMTPFLNGEFGNASSRHAWGRRARQAVENAREEVAAACGAKPAQVVFTASGTESNNAIIKGAAAMTEKKFIAVNAAEHPCVLCAARRLQTEGLGFVPVAVQKDGRADLGDLERSLGGGEKAGGAFLASVMLANNETGVINDVAAAADIARKHGAWLHTDAAQALGKIAVDFAALGADAMTLSAHKAGGPKGAAALVVRDEVRWSPLMDGGGQENGRRSGTENVAAIVGFGAAARLGAERVKTETARMNELHKAAENGLREAGAVIFGEGARLPNTLCFGVKGIDGETMAVMLDQSGFAVSSGAACGSMKDEPSHVLLAMGYEAEAANTAVRVSWGGGTTREELEGFVAAVRALAGRLAGLSAMTG